MRIDRKEFIEELMLREYISKKLMALIESKHSKRNSEEEELREVMEETGLKLEEPIAKLYDEGNITFYKAHMPDKEVSLSHEHSEHKFVTKDNIPDNMSGKFKRAIKKAL